MALGVFLSFHSVLNRSLRSTSASSSVSASASSTTTKTTTVTTATSAEPSEPIRKVTCRIFASNDKDKEKGKRYLVQGASKLKVFIKVNLVFAFSARRRVPSPGWGWTRRITTIAASAQIPADRTPSAHLRRRPAQLRPEPKTTMRNISIRSRYPYWAGARPFTHLKVRFSLNYVILA